MTPLAEGAVRFFAPLGFRSRLTRPAVDAVAETQKSLSVGMRRCREVLFGID